LSFSSDQTDLAELPTGSLPSSAVHAIGMAEGKIVAQITATKSGTLCCSWVYDLENGIINETTSLKNVSFTVFYPVQTTTTGTALL
jgi:hypothetical protein